ncbi:hypothetical protein [Mucilaginibacter flavus]|uniref:hypothetical protein n=1 Tax=Mucilaginibacter flavus TaxID=931504 RepID=UPI0025B34F11|nr:hypothetical protein [Mucilaginibacter flavus]MDN3579392.1 hypothetical protein [Mucilaginibacter flavus]
MVIDNISELKVLVDVFYGLKFGIDNDELNQILRSPFFSQIFNKAVIEMIGHYKAIKTLDDNPVSISEWELKCRQRERKKIINYLLEVESWEDIDESAQLEIIKNMFSPFIYDKEDIQMTLAELIKR